MAPVPEAKIERAEGPSHVISGIDIDPNNFIFKSQGLDMNLDFKFPQNTDYVSLSSKKSSYIGRMRAYVHATSVAGYCPPRNKV